MTVAHTKTEALTSQQQVVVAHGEGPALVFAVAGAGKTTAMVHRIARLVGDGVTRPGRILATSFGRANVRDLQHALRPWPACRAVDTRTLHALGLDAIRRAQAHGTERQWDLAPVDAHRVLDEALRDAFRRDVPYKKELDGMDRQDFLAYVGVWKGSLRYADVAQVDLPPAGRQVAREVQAPPPPLDWYLDLYRLYETVRRQRGWITFDDMLRTGWEVLVRHPDVLAEVQARYQYVLVDEFQDVNRAQAEILDLITTPQRNYMAIGDDDQTIYEWRGADPAFILGFAERYDATTYVIDENFRCPAGPLVLANRVIKENKQRQEKRLRLTQGFGGRARLHFDKDLAAMAEGIGDRVKSLHENGVPLNDVAVLVRLNAQTPHIEQALIARKVPYRVSKPFYARPEIRTLIHYCRLGWIEREMRRDKALLSSESAQEKFHESWRDVGNRPQRYVAWELRRQIAQRVLQGERPSVAVAASARFVQEWLAERLEALAEDLDWLSRQLARPGDEVLRQLEERLHYKDFLRDSSGFAQTGTGRAAGVDAFIAYARERGTVLAFMSHVSDLKTQQIGQRATWQDDAVTLTTIHRAKGQEWPVVMVPQCNQEIIPFEGGSTLNVEEERRLLYVAITRSKRDLHLHSVRNEPLSQFLRESHARRTLRQVRELAAILDQDPATWRAQDALKVARRVRAFGLDSYFRHGHWWEAAGVPPAGRRAAIAGIMQRFFAAVTAADGLSSLRLRRADGDLWQEMAAEGGPADEIGTFPGLDEILPSLAERARPGKDESAQTTEDGIAVEDIWPGMWIRCDAGWGRVTAMHGGVLDVVLRPGVDGVKVVVDVPAGWITFPGADAVYTCTKCHRFSTTDPHLISRGHNDAAHSGTGPRYRRERKSRRTLNHLEAQAQPPSAELS